MRRLTPKRLVEAMEKTGYSLVQFETLNHTSKCGCPMGLTSLLDALQDPDVNPPTSVTEVTNHCDAVYGEAYTFTFMAIFDDHPEEVIPGMFVEEAEQDALACKELLCK